jgi:hypothetical protein
MAPRSIPRQDEPKGGNFSSSLRLRPSNRVLLLVSMVRHVSSQAKAGKDRQQASEMIEVLLEGRPGDIELAVESINRRPQSWRNKLRNGLDRLPETTAGAKQRILQLLAA